MKVKQLFVSNHKEELKTSTLCFNVVLVFVFLFFVLKVALSQVGITLDFSFLQEFRIRIIDGFILTIKMSLASLTLSLISGILVAMGTNSNVIAGRVICNLYVKFIRGTPLISQIYLFYYIIGTAIGVENRFIAGVMILSIFEGAYIAEIIRGSLISIENSQLEVAKAVGFNKIQTLTQVIIPQLVARTLPALTGQFASIIKDSSLLSIIAVIEITQTMREITAINYKMFEAYFALSILYLLLTLPLMFISERFERRFNYANRI